MGLLGKGRIKTASVKLVDTLNIPPPTHQSPRRPVPYKSYTCSYLSAFASSGWPNGELPLRVSPHNAGEPVSWGSPFDSSSERQNQGGVLFFPFPFLQHMPSSSSRDSSTLYSQRDFQSNTSLYMASTFSSSKSILGLFQSHTQKFRKNTKCHFIPCQLPRNKQIPKYWIWFLGFQARA